MDPDPQPEPGPVAEPAPTRHWSVLTALVLGILALVVGLIPFLGVLTILLLGPLAIIFGLIALSRTRGPAAVGRRKAVVGLSLGVAGFIAAWGWVWFVSYSLDKSFDNLYGSDAETPGPGRTRAEAIPFTETSMDAEGILISVAPPRAEEVPLIVLRAENGWDIGWGTTVTFTNTGDEAVLFQPGATAYLDDSTNACRDAVDSPRPDVSQLQPGQTETLTFSFNCYAYQEVQDTIYLRTFPEPYSTMAWFTTALPDGARQALPE